MSKRTATSRTTVNADGSYTTELFADAINYQPAGSSDWQPIDLTFASSSDGKSASVTKSPTAVTVRSAADPNGVLSVNLGGQAITLRPATPSASSVPPAVTGSEADVPAVLPGVSLRIFSSAKGVNVFLVLAQAPAAPTFTFLIDAPNLTVSLDKTSGRLLLKDAKNTLVGSFHAPYAVDSTPDELTGGGRVTSAVSYSLGKIGGKPAVTISVDPAWLASATYPVYIDPTIYNDGTNTYGDASVNQGNPNLNYGNYKRPDSPGYYEMWLGESPSDSTYYNEAFIKFDTSSISDTTVDSASIEVRPYHQYYNAPTATNTWLRKVTGSWTESAITWNTKPAVASGYIDVTGCVEGQQCAFSVTSLVQGWATTPSSNNGIRLDENGNGPTYWKRLIASEEQTTTRPRLIVTTHDPVATPTTPTGPRNSRTLNWAYSDSGSDPQSHYEIDVDTDSGFAAPLTYDGAATAGTSPSAAIPGTVTLTSGTTYYWRVKVKNGTSWSAWGSSSFIWDTTAPAVPSTPDLASTSDSGSSNTDNITNDTTPTLTGTETENGSTVTIIDNGTTPVGSAVVSGGTWTVTTSALGSGSHSLTATATDVATNTSAASGALTVTIDTTAPAAPSMPDLVASSDSGSSTTDNITNDTTPTVSGAEAENGVTVTITADGATAVGSGTVGSQVWTVTTAALASGGHSLTASATDAAGNASASSAGLPITIDTTAPSAPSTPDLTTASDSGASNTDNLTKITTPVFTGTAGENGATVNVIDSVTGLSAGSATVSSGTWTVTTSTRAAGAHVFSATATDVAGNVSSASSGLTVTIDTTAPAAPSTPDLTAASDTGSSDTDDITSDTTPTLTGTAAENGATVTILDNGATQLGTAPVVSGAWSITTDTLSAGVHSLTATVTDTAGNVSASSSSLSVTITADPPNAPSKPDLSATSDSGSSNADDLTNDATPTLTGTAEPGSTVRLFEGPTQLGSATAVGGTWSITTSSLGDGSHQIYAVADNGAGTSPASTALAITIDTVAPAVPAVPDLADSSDTGSSASDDLTNDTTPTVVGASSEDGAMITIIDGGSVSIGSATVASGAWSVTTSTLSNGVHPLSATASDVAGNVSAPSASLSITIDSTAPTAPTTPDLASSADSGHSVTDNITNLGTILLTGSASENGSTVTLVEGAMTDGTATVENGAWSVEISGLSEGGHTIVARSVDSAGNMSAASAGLTVIVDHTLPLLTIGAPSADSVQAGSQAAVTWTDSDANGISTRMIRRESMAANGKSLCVGFEWVAVATTAATSPNQQTGLSTNTCYRWVVTIVDTAGNAVDRTTPAIMVDLTAPQATLTGPAANSTTDWGLTSAQVTWTEPIDSSTIAQRSLQRQRAALSGGVCSATWTDEGSPNDQASPVVDVGLAPETCYRWRQTLSDGAGNAATATSGILRTGQVLLERPIAGQAMFGSQPVSAVTSLGSVISIDFLVDGAVIASATTAPFASSFDTTTLADGSHTMIARATVSGGGQTSSQAAGVTIANALSAVDRLRTDDAFGAVDTDAYVRNGVYAVLAPAAADPRYRSQTPSDLSDGITDYVARLSLASAAAQDEVTTFLNQPLRGEFYRPTATLGMPTSYADCGPGVAYPNPNGGPDLMSWTCITTRSPFTLIYAISGTGNANTLPDGDANNDGLNDRADEILDRLIDVYDYYTDPVAQGGLGFPQLVSGSQTINVVMGDPDGVLGATTGLAEPGLVTGPGGIILQADYQNLLDHLIAHELFHLIQYAYHNPFSDGPIGLGEDQRSFWREATANWASHQYVRHVRQAENNPSFGINGPWTGDVGAYLGTSELSLNSHSPNNEQREYAVSLLAEYLDEISISGATPVKRTWELIDGGQTAMQAISNAVNEQAGRFFPSEFQHYAETAYTMSFNDADQSSWVHALQDYATRPGHMDPSYAYYTGPFSDCGTNPQCSFGADRPKRHLALLSPGADQRGSMSIGEQGMGYVDLVPNTASGFIQVHVQQPDDNVSASVVTYRFKQADHTKGTEQCVAYPMTFTDRQGALQVPFDSSCSFATLIVSRFGPGEGLFGPGEVGWSASSSSTLVVDDFNRSAPFGSRFGTATNGQTWATGPATSGQLRAVNPDAFALDGSVGTIWGHPDQPGEDYADPWTSLNLSRSLPVDVEMKFSIDPWAWLTASGTFEPNIIVGDASDWSAMTKRIGLDFYKLAPDTAGITLVSPWAAPDQQIPFEPDVWYRYRLRITPTEIDHKIWRDGEPEPSTWTSVSTAPTGQSLTMSNAYLWLYNANYGVRFSIDWITMQN